MEGAALRKESAEYLGSKPEKKKELQGLDLSRSSDGISQQSVCFIN